MELEYQETKLCKCVYMTEEEGKGVREGGKGRQNERKEEKEKGGGREDYKTETHNMYVLS